MIHNIGEACTGCSACASICSRKAIEMLRDKEGFLYPEVEPEKCSQCGKCSRVCHLDVKPQSTCESMTYAGVCINDEIRMGSSSGGVFSVLAQSVFQDGGAVCGAVLSDDFKSLQHTVVWNEADLEALRGSKYLQSSMEDVYSEIRALLEEKCPVLFCGTPCQVSGLNRYLGKEYEHLDRKSVV